jgi:hypothetical protein
MDIVVNNHESVNLSNLSNPINETRSPKERCMIWILEILTSRQTYPNHTHISSDMRRNHSNSYLVEEEVYGGRSATG